MPVHKYGTFTKALETGKLASAYYFLGAENVRKDEATTALLDKVLDPGLRDFNLDIRSAGQLEPEDVLSLCSTLPMMADRRVVVVKDVEAWKRKTRGKAAVLKYLERPSPETLLILVQGAAAEARDDKPDTDISKHAYTVEFDEADADEAADWLAREAGRLGVVFEQGAAQHLINAVGTDLAAIRSELQKLSGIAHEGPVSAERVGDMVGVHYGETPLDWRNAVLEKDAKKALDLVPVVLAQSGVSGVRLVSLLGTSLTATAVARAHLDRKVRGGQLVTKMWDVLKRARPGGIGKWGDEVNNFCRWAERWPAADLRRALKAALEADQALKSTRIADDAAVTQELVLRILAKSAG